MVGEDYALNEELSHRVDFGEFEEVRPDQGWESEHLVEVPHLGREGDFEIEEYVGERPAPRYRYYERPVVVERTVEYSVEYPVEYPVKYPAESPAEEEKEEEKAESQDEAASEEPESAATKEAE